MTHPNNPKHQAAFRARRAERFARMETKLREIVKELDGNEKPLAIKLRALAEEGLR